MSYPAIIVGLAERFRTVAALDVVLDYSPTALHVDRALYMTLDTFGREQAGQVTAMRYRIECHICVRYQDNEGAERELADLINPVCAAVDADPRLGGAIQNGLAVVADGEAGYEQIGEVWYRTCTVFVEALEKAPVRSGI